MYEGKMILRFDDTNPMNEKIEFVDNIIRDLATLEIKPDRITFTSDYFDKTKECMEQLIKLGLAYADDTPSEQMKAERDVGTESKYREATVEENLKRFYLMLEGKHHEELPAASKEEKKKGEEKKATEPVAPAAPQSDWCMRGKLNMQCPVKCLRDPVFYRIKRDSHHRTGTKYKAYPTYDFACPIVDAIEDVTHCLRTIEYHDRNALYDWVQEKLGLRKVTIYDYSRLNLVSTILSKRSLKWFVEEGIADGWYDPRFPTVQGIMRRGLTVEALKQFMLEQGPSKNTNLMEWDKLWALNKDIIDPTTPRYTAIVKSTACKLFIENGPATPEARSQTLHPKNESIGSKAVIYGRELWVEKDDAVAIEVGEKVTLMKWGNVTITKKDIAADGNPVLFGTVDEADKDFKKTKKLTWVCADPDTTVEITLTEFDHLINKKKVEENDDVKQLVNHNSRIEYTAIAEGSLRTI
jgi:glutamyl-tRNA synthetase